MVGLLDADDSEEQKEVPTLRSAAAFRGSFSSFLMQRLAESYGTLFPEAERPGTQSLASQTQARSPASSPKSPVSSPRAQADHDAEDDGSGVEMEVHSFLLDVATSALLMLSHKEGAEGGLQLINFAMVRMYGILHISLLDAYQYLSPQFVDLTGVEHRWLAFAAFICIQRWNSHHRIIRVTPALYDFKALCFDVRCPVSIS
jgi:hypothetical protein